MINLEVIKKRLEERFYGDGDITDDVKSLVETVERLTGDNEILLKETKRLKEENRELNRTRGGAGFLGDAW